MIENQVFPNGGIRLIAEVLIVAGCSSGTLATINSGHWYFLLAVFHAEVGQTTAMKIFNKKNEFTAV